MSSEEVKKEVAPKKKAAPKKKVLAEASKKERFPEKPSFEEYLHDLHRRWNESGDISRKKHHPDMHMLGASPQCPLCDVNERSAKERYEYDFKESK